MNEIKIKLYLYKNIREKLAEIPADYISSDIPFNFMDVDEFELTIPKYKNDKNSPTPYIDGILSTYKKYNKDEYISKILENISDTKLFDLGKIHGEMQNYIYELKQIENILNQDFLYL